MMVVIIQIKKTKRKMLRNKQIIQIFVYELSILYNLICLPQNNEKINKKIKKSITNM